MSDRSAQFLDHRFLGLTPAASTSALAGEVGQRGAVAVVGLEPARAQLLTSCLRFRRCEQPQRTGMEPLEFGCPRPMQCTCRFDRDHLLARVRSQHLLQSSDPRPRDRKRHRFLQQAGAVADPNPVHHLSRIHGHDHRRRIQGNLQHAHELPPCERTRPESTQLQLTTYQLLEAWLAADHPWKPSTYVGYGANARALARDPVAQRPAAALSPHEIRHRLAAWQAAGASDAVVAPRFRVLRACLTWAYNERLLDTHPLRMMRGPLPTPPRQALTGEEIRALLLTAETRVREAHANLPWAVREADADWPVAPATPRLAVRTPARLTCRLVSTHHAPPTPSQALRHGGACALQNKTCCWCAWPQTAVPAAASWSR
ncbi:hypothetical protein QI633_25245 [Nocardioides sp. QY071]|uniref:hypothetical protein n=1 Tax=Nocardioides sp. QY071 TaxID=3044187 RepID=UPI00249A3127|nr:hypothetical protein [Nocardioides sp. QY071]WGY01826.1 hypothetical protein QI633_25245 [Nocardioides sp. QY071]